MDTFELYNLLLEKDINLHVDTLYKARMRGHMSRNLAIICEDATGIGREQWVFPEKFGDPWRMSIGKRRKK